MSDSTYPGSASLHEAAGRTGALPSRIRPVAAGTRLQGPAYPLRCPGGDNLWLHRAVATAPAGSVLVAEVGGAAEFGYWGEILSHAALARGLAGLVIDGGVRDAPALAELGFPVFSNGLCIRGTDKDPARGGALAVPVRIGDVEIRPGDHVAGDEDGVVAVPAASAAAVVQAARDRDRDEAIIIERLRAGQTTIDIYGLPT